MNYIGIDMSMTSTGICVEKNGLDHFYNFVEKESKHTKQTIVALESENINIIETKALHVDDKSSDYSLKEKTKIDNCMKMMDLISQTLLQEDCIVAIEGISYGSSGLRGFDISGYHYVLRRLLVENPFVKSWEIYSPGSIKKFAVKGNAKKNEMLEAYLKGNYNNNLTKLIKNNDFLYMNKKGVLKKEPDSPVGDLVDAFFIKEYLKSQVI